MKKAEWKKRSINSFLTNLIGIAIFCTMAFLIIFGLSNVGESSSAEGQRLLEQSLLRASMSCYAIEGSYPSSLMYLTENYGVIIDEEKYAVHYDIFASNIVPTITVIPLEN